MPQRERKKRVIISVYSDLVTDQRVHRQAVTLTESGYEVKLLGRKLKNTLSMEDRPYRVKRFTRLFEKGFLGYASYNKRLLLELLMSRADIFISNDLDTLLPNFIVSKLRGKILIYDSHEYFTEVPELTNRSFIKWFWLKIEKSIFPRLKNVMTVNQSIADIYSKKYGVPVKVVRNTPVRNTDSRPAEERSKWNLPLDKKLFLFQGAGINIDRGGEEAIDAISRVNDAALLFIGGGDVIESLKNKVKEMKLGGTVFFIPKQSMHELQRFTRMADFGLTLDKDSNLNYRYSLPNKLFDYIHAGIPVLASNLVEVRSIIERYEIGLIIHSSDAPALSEEMKEMMSDETRIDRWKNNLNIAAAELNWEKEKKFFLEVIEHAV